METLNSNGCANVFNLPLDEKEGFINYSMRSWTLWFLHDGSERQRTTKIVLLALCASSSQRHRVWTFRTLRMTMTPRVRIAIWSSV